MERPEGGNIDRIQQIQTPSEPEESQKLILEKLKLSLPPQPPPRLRAGKLEWATQTDHPKM